MGSLIQPPWKIDRAWDVEPVPGSDRDYAKTFVLSNGKDEVQTTVEYASRANDAGPAAAERIVRTFLAGPDTPPRRILVARDGSFSAIE
jgi:hypothetical protein